MFRPHRAIIMPYKNRFVCFQYILGSQTIYKGGMMLQCCVLKKIAHSIVTSYHLCKQFGVPKCTGSKRACSYNKAWWWPDGAETCSLVCTFNGIYRCVRWIYTSILCLNMEHIGTNKVKNVLTYAWCWVNSFGNQQLIRNVQIRNKIFLTCANKKRSVGIDILTQMEAKGIT